MFQEVNELEAVTAAATGREALLLIYPEDEKEDMEILNLTDILKDFTSGASRCVFLVNQQPKKAAAPAASADDVPEIIDPPGTRKRKKVEIDVGKIVALHNAGWNNNKIAEEMHLSAVTVGKYLRMERAKQEEQKNHSPAGGEI